MAKLSAKAIDMAAMAQCFKFLFAGLLYSLFNSSRGPISIIPIRHKFRQLQSELLFFRLQRYNIIINKSRELKDVAMLGEP